MDKLPALCKMNMSALYGSYDGNYSGEDGHDLQDMNMDELTLVYNLKYYMYGIVIPVICVLGFIGNILNIFVFSWKRNQRIIDDIEKCTTTCLMALAVSDMLFCLCTFPNAFMKKYFQYYKTDFMLYYKTFSIAIISNFIMTSTILTVITAIMRYLAICHPFHSSSVVSMHNTISVIVVTFVFSTIFNIPYLWRYKIIDDECNPGAVHIHQPPHLFDSETFEYVYRMIWAMLGNFIPLVILMYCNVRLIQALRLSRQLRMYHCRDDTSHVNAHRRITLTLVAIIILFLILVAPSETIKFALHMMGTNENKKHYHKYQIASMVTNVLQSLNFSVNFILYYAMIAPFRKTLHEFVCLAKRRSQSSGNGSAGRQQQTVMLLTLRNQGQSRERGT